MSRWACEEREYSRQENYMNKAWKKYLQDVCLSLEVRIQDKWYQPDFEEKLCGAFEKLCEMGFASGFFEEMIGE